MDKIEAALKRVVESDARHLQVEVRGSNVILGSVRASFEREEAEKAAWPTEGISAAENPIIDAP